MIILFKNNNKNTISQSHKVTRHETNLERTGLCMAETLKASVLICCSRLRGMTFN